MSVAFLFDFVFFHLFPYAGQNTAMAPVISGTYLGGWTGSLVSLSLWWYIYMIHYYFYAESIYY